MTELLVKKFVKDHESVEKMSVRTAYGVLASVVGIFCNVILFIAKFLIGTMSHSVSIIADGFNNLSDAGSSIISFAGIKMASKPADEEHPFGHGRMEYVTALVVAFLVIDIGLSFLKDSIGKIRNPEEIQFHVISVIVLLLSIAVKLWLGFFNKKLGTKINSQVMMASAADAMGDVLATSATIISILVFHFLNINIDSFVGIGVSLVVMKAGVGIAKDTLEPLLGEAIPKEICDQITKFVESYDGIQGTHDLIVHNYGPGRSMASVHAEVPNDVNIEVSHEIIDKIERDAVKELGMFLVIHMDPIELNNEQLEAAKVKVERVVKGIDGALSIHDFRMVDGKHQINLIFDLVVPIFYDADKKKEVCKTIRRKVYELDTRYQCVIQVESSFVAEDK